MAHQDELSLQQCRKFVGMYPDVAMPHHELWLDYAAQQNYTKAVDELEQEIKLEGNGKLAEIFGRAYSASGWTELLKKQAEIYQTPEEYGSEAVAESY